MRKRLIICGIAMFFCVTAVCFIMNGGSSDLDQSEIEKVLEPLLKAQKATFDIEISTGGLTLAKMQGMFKLPTQSRLSLGDDLIIWNDFKKSEFVMLSRYSKTVSVTKTHDPTKGLGIGLLSIRNSLERIINEPNTTFKALGEDKINGKDVVGYKIKNKEFDLVYWADLKKGTPVRIVSDLYSEDGSTKIVISSIDIAPTIDDGLFNVYMPDGYTVNENTETDSSDASKVNKLLKGSTDLIKLSKKLNEAIHEYNSIPLDQPARKKEAEEKMQELQKQLKSLTKEVLSLTKTN